MSCRPISPAWPVILVCIGVLGGLCAVSADAQDSAIRSSEDPFVLPLIRATGPLTLDGIPNEPFWEEAHAADDFWMKQPLVKPGAQPRTIIKMAYDEQFLYMAAWCYEEEPVIIKTLRRDGDYWRGDGVGVLLDPVNQHTFGYFFGVNPYGTQADGIILGVNQAVQSEWDGRFYAETQRYPDHWTAELAIPLASLRFSPDNTRWGINFIRNNFNQNETHTWVPIPQQFVNTDINYTGLLLWPEAPQQRTSNISLIPYALAGYQKDVRATNPVQFLPEIGLDARIGLASSLNLDLTLNPDFSQAEIDEQPVNLTRFNILLPERRQFFLENRDVFTRFGTSDLQPFFSRRIGLDEQGRAIPILAGARLTGNVAPDTRIGVLNMQTEGRGEQAAQNFAALAVHHQVLKRSILRALVTNRQAIGRGTDLEQDYGRNAGMEAMYLSEDGRMEAWGRYHHAFRSGIRDKNGMYSAGFVRRTRRWTLGLDGEGVGEHFYADMGFTPRIENYDASRDTIIRLGYHQLSSQLQFSTFPEGPSWFNRHWAELNNRVFLNPDGSFNEASHRFNYSFFFKDRRFLRFFGNLQQVNLLFPTRFIRGGAPLPPALYGFRQGGVFFDTDSRRPWYFLIGLDGGEFYNGSILSSRGGITYRVQPYGSVSFNASWNRLRLPDDFGEADIVNLTTRLDITFTRDIFWTTFFQFNTQQQVLNINSRFQWRFAPLSDLFVVYTDSYDTPGGFLRERSRTLLVKLNYWWTI
jgi:hypothetical protein